MNTDLEKWYHVEKKIQETVFLASDALRHTDPEEVTGAELQHLQNVRTLLYSAMWYLGMVRDAILENAENVIV